MKCKKCNSEVTPIEKPRRDTPHEAELRCPVCIGFLGWKPKEKNEKKYEKRPTGCPTPEELDINICQICLRKRQWLGKNETLETHHIDDDPTHNELLNFLVVCTACHKFINWIRTYFHDHLKDLYEGKML